MIHSVDVPARATVVIQPDRHAAADTHVADRPGPETVTVCEVWHGERRKVLDERRRVVAGEAEPGRARYVMVTVGTGRVVAPPA